MVEGVTLRAAVAGDVAAIDTVYNAARRLEVGDDPEQARRFLRLPTGTTTLAVESGAVVGFVTVTEEEVRFLYVRPDRQGAGIGASLLRTALAQIDGLARLTVYRDNAAALRLYRRHGFAVETTVSSVLVMRRDP